MDLKSKAIHATIWSLAERVGAEAVRLAVTVILARLLLPEQYGLVAMLFVFLSIVNTFMDSGLGMALIQKKDADLTDFSSVFYFNVSVGLAAYLFFFVLAPFIAGFYSEPKLVPLTRFMSLSLVALALGMVHGVILEKEVDFKALTKISFLSLISSGIIAVWLARDGAGVWAIAVQSVVFHSVRSALLWYFVDWRPSPQFSIAALKPLYSFGYKILGYRLLETTFQNIYTLIIGKYFRARELGYYTQAKTMQDVVANNLANIFERVTFPVLSKIQDDDKRLKDAYQRVLKLLAFLNFPIMLGLMVVAEPLVHLIFGERWLPAVPYIQLLSVAGAVYTVQAININIIKVKGRSDLILKLEIVKKAIAVGLIFIGLPWGVRGILIGFVVSTYLGFFINSRYSGALIEYSQREQIRDMLPYGALSCGMAIVTYGIGAIPGPGDLVRLLIQVSFACAVYYLGAFLFHVEALSLFHDIVKTNIFRRQSS